MTSTSEPAGPSLEEALAEIERLENINLQLLADLEECKDQLFELVQKSNDIPEQTIKDALIRIIEGIESWIDDISGDESFSADFRLQYQRNLQSGNRDALFRKLFKQHCSDITWQMNLSQIDNCHYAVLSLLISRSLVGNIFLASDEFHDWNLYPLGLSMHQISFIRQVERAMTSQGVDGNQYPKWRSETVSALATTRRYQSTLEDDTRRYCTELKADLSDWIGDKLVSEHFTTLRERVIEPAIKLVDMTCRSHKIYVLSFDAVPPGSFPSDSANWNFKDISTWRNVPGNELLGCTTTLYPGIIRKGSNSQDDLLLVKPAALGYRDLALQPRPSRSNSPYPSRSEPGRLEREPSDLAKYGTGRRSDREAAADTSKHRLSRRQSSPKKTPHFADAKAPAPRQKANLKSLFDAGLGRFIGLTPDGTNPAPQPSPPPAQKSRRPSTKTTPHQQRHEQEAPSSEIQTQNTWKDNSTEEPAYHSRALMVQEQHHTPARAATRVNADVSHHGQVSEYTYGYELLEPWHRNTSPR